MPCRWCAGDKLCRMCGGEGKDLPGHCPRKRMSIEQRELVREKKFDFQNGAWVKLVVEGKTARAWRKPTPRPRAAPPPPVAPAGWTRAMLLALPREEIEDAARGVGLLVRDEPDAVLIDSVLAMQGELAGRAVRSIEVRVLNLEQSVLALEQHVVRLGRLLADMATWIERRNPGTFGAAAMQDVRIFYRLSRTRGRY